jgi:cation transporter-like permease
VLGVGFSIAMDAYNIDPANGAAPLLTTVTDLIGITILCGISAALFAGEFR